MKLHLYPGHLDVDWPMLHLRAGDWQIAIYPGTYRGRKTWRYSHLTIHMWTLAWLDIRKVTNIEDNEIVDMQDETIQRKIEPDFASTKSTDA